MKTLVFAVSLVAGAISQTALAQGCDLLLSDGIFDSVNSSGTRYTQGNGITLGAAGR